MSHSATIIVIEDEAQIRRFLRTTLAAEGYQVIEAETGKQGLTEAATRKPDLIILDLGLPDMDGEEVVKGVRSWSPFRSSSCRRARRRVTRFPLWMRVRMITWSNLSAWASCWRAYEWHCGICLL